MDLARDARTVKCNTPLCGESVRAALVGDAASRLAAAYLREHPADDAEQVTEEWLQAVGFEFCPAAPTPRWKLVLCVQDYGFDEGTSTHWLEIMEPIADCDGDLWWPIEYCQQHDRYDGKPVRVALLSWIERTTRGHVRHLVRALGGQMAEPVNGNEGVA